MIEKDYEPYHILKSSQFLMIHLVLFQELFVGNQLDNDTLKSIFLHKINFHTIELCHQCNHLLED